MWTSQFWKGQLEFAIVAFVGAFVASLVQQDVGLFEADFREAASFGGMAAVVAFGGGFATLKVGPKDTPSIVNRKPDNVLDRNYP